MKPIVAAMLFVDAILIVVAVYSVVFKRATQAGRRPTWLSFASSLLVGGMASVQIAANHQNSAGGGLLQFGGALLIGMALMGGLIALRERRGRDAVQIEN